MSAELLDELRAALLRYVVLPSAQVTDAVTLWVATTHALPAFSFAPRLVINSPEKRCGKSRLLDVIEATCHSPETTTNASVSAIFRMIDNDCPPTLLIDEADAIFGTRKQAEQHEDLRSLVNAGHQRGRYAVRCVGPQQTPTRFSTFAMVALAGIGELPDTIVDRAVNVTMRRRAPGEEVQAFRHRRDRIPLRDLSDRLAAWATSVRAVLEAAEPEMPVEDRAADTWEPLIAVADAAGGSWPNRARAAALTMTAEVEGTAVEQSLGVRLLTDVRDIFADLHEPEVASADLVERLRKNDEAPWESFGLTQRDLAYRLRAYGVRPKQVRPDGTKQVRGYTLADLADTFTRYLTEGPSPSVTASQKEEKRRSDGQELVTDASDVTDVSVTTNGAVTNPEGPDLQERHNRDAVTGRDGTCSVCGGVMPFLDPWQSTHPGCDTEDAWSA